MSRSVAERRSPIGAAAARALGALLVAVATLACLSVSADATTTSAYAYDGSRSDVDRIEVASAAVADAEPTQTALSPLRSHGYDDASNLARTTVRQGGYRLAPNTPGSNGCGLPVFMPGADTPDTTRHIDDAIDIAGRKPGGSQRSLLTYAGPGSGPGRGWTRNDPRCSARGAAQWCDEYPFQSTLQAGPGASLELVPAWEQRIQAGKLSSFYSACGLSAGDDFLVTPSFAVPVTTWMC